ncbi:MAG TPA: DUF3079 domain-containing protein [Burkholderiaceae bacterium]|nr:DUF3079 domain-containing protein [Burkholderiaceae bacterium]HMZ02649.1 DUF3079 domain-containing protein [Burkholderiaceae bacterium]HNG79958.1 DUF3079 domain-containing protein [Burkholderiaceae bacterium]
MLKDVGAQGFFSGKPAILGERDCWGCDHYCAADDMRCGNGSDRTQHPMELFGEDWAAWDLGPPSDAADDVESAPPGAASPR